MTRSKFVQSEKWKKRILRFEMRCKWMWVLTSLLDLTNIPTFILIKLFLCS